MPLGLSLADSGTLDDIFRLLDALPDLSDDLPKRILSVRLYRDSKRLEALESRIVRVLRTYALADRTHDTPLALTLDDPEGQVSPSGSRLDEQITARLAGIRAARLEHFDEEVTARLWFSKEQATAQMDRLERFLWSLTRHELRDSASFQDEALEIRDPRTAGLSGVRA